MESALDWHAARAALEWQMEMGVAEVLCDAPVDRFALEDAAKEARAAKKRAGTGAAGQAAPALEPQIDPVAEAQAAAAAAGTLSSLQAAMAAFELCELKRGARNLVFGEGAAHPKVMVVGEAPDRDEDRSGKPFVEASGTLMDKMLAAIGLSRAENAYLTTVLPWRPPQGRDPRPEDIAMMKPFLERHIALVDPAVVIVMGNTACQSLLGKRGITRLRGQWTDIGGKPALPMMHPQALMRQPALKREAWADLLSVKARLKELS
ncbi:uracil-DNA glycosylase [Sagittula sp. SSi028]|uniref:uracil-DNA glycosylase n=1 Tax=Sagittula sp. SSi028 TaxID=3400636 RepID=UPI003AF91B50